MKTAEDNTPIVEQGDRYCVDVETRHGTVELDIIAANGGVKIILKPATGPFVNLLDWR